MLVSDFDFHLPEELIAQAPLAGRDASRMLVVDRAAGSVSDASFRDLPAYLRAGDCLVLNDTRVIPARLHGHRRGHTGHVEVLLVKPLPERGGDVWLTLARPGRKLPEGTRIEFGADLSAEILSRAGHHGERVMRFDHGGDFHAAVERVGHVPLPPYIRRDDAAADRARYQTVYAREPGSVAAPTAGLHFTPEVIAACEAAGAEVARVTLHVGLGTFQPLNAESLSEVKLHGERYEVTESAAGAIARARRVVAVGTTSVRTLESTGGAAGSGETSLFISPGYAFRRAGAMLTNFHLPKSSLFVLVSAFGGVDLMRSAYEHAVRQRYRFYSYGDCMLIL